jgi:hypothetical protein
MKTKRTIKKRAMVLVCALVLIAEGTPQCFASNDPAAMAFDAVLIRPVCLVATVLGGAFFVISLPVAATSKSVQRAATAMVVKPAQATFTRPLGDFDYLSYYGGEARSVRPPQQHRRG